MGIAGVKIKIMPTSPDVNLDEIAEKAKELVEKQGGKNRKYEEEPVAFGLKAVIAFFEWDEAKDSEKLAKEFEEIENVNSAQVIDVRRLIQ